MGNYVMEMALFNRWGQGVLSREFSSQKKNGMAQTIPFFFAFLAHQTAVLTTAATRQERNII